MVLNYALRDGQKTLCFDDSLCRNLFTSVPEEHLGISALSLDYWFHVRCLRKFKNEEKVYGIESLGLQQPCRSIAQFSAVTSTENSPMDMVMPEPHP